MQEFRFEESLLIQTWNVESPSIPLTCVNINYPKVLWTAIAVQLLLEIKFRNISLFLAVIGWDTSAHNCAPVNPPLNVTQVSIWFKFYHLNGVTLGCTDIESHSKIIESKIENNDL